jgi:hypothetical protein
MPYLNLPLFRNCTYRFRIIGVNVISPSKIDYGSLEIINVVGKRDRNQEELHNDQVHNLYPSANIKVIKLRGVRWAGHVTCMGDMRCEMRTKFWSENLKGGEHQGDIGIDGRY